jgi:hypothetical protein
MRWRIVTARECGALNEWLQVAPQAQPVRTFVGKLVSVDDFSIRPARGMTPQTEGVLRSLANLKPEMLAVMHGSS